MNCKAATEYVKSTRQDLEDMLEEEQEGSRVYTSRELLDKISEIRRELDELEAHLRASVLN